MKQATDPMTELNQIMADALLKIKKLVDDDETNQHDLVNTTKWFLLGVISTAIDLVEFQEPNNSPILYAEVEAAAKAGGLRAIQKLQSQGNVHYSVSNIEPYDATMAMNYIGQALGTTLFKTIHELPIPLRKPEMFLRGIEALLANLLSQKFNHSHDVLDSLCEHVHMALNDLKSRQH